MNRSLTIILTLLLIVTSMTILYTTCTKAPTFIVETTFEEGYGKNVTFVPEGSIKLSAGQKEKRDGFSDDSMLSQIDNLNHNDTRGEIGLITTFSKLYDSQVFDKGFCLKETTDGGYIISGISGGDYLLQKISYNGVLTWRKTFNRDESDEGNSVLQTVDGGYIIAGTSGRYQGNYDIWIVKTDRNGNQQWQKSFGRGSRNEEGNEICRTNDGGYLIVGTTSSYGNGSTDAWLIKIDGNGNEAWNKTFGDAGTDRGNCVKQTRDGGYIIGGYDGSDLWLIKTNINGNEQWQKSFDGRGWSDLAHGISQTNDGGYIIAGKNGWGSTCDAWLLKTNANGNKQWQKIFSSNNINKRDLFYSVSQTQDGGYITAGTYLDGEKSWLVKTDRNGNKLWEDRTSRGGHGFCAIESTNGGYVFTGYDSSGQDRLGKVYVIKKNTQGNSGSSKGTLISSNILNGEIASSIDVFNYSTKIPSGTSMKIQFSQDNIRWYDSSGVQDEWDAMNNNGGHIDLFDLNWDGSTFYYKVDFHADTGDCNPILSMIELSFCSNYDEGYYESIPVSGGTGDIVWKQLEWRGTWDKDTLFKFQLRSSSTVEGLPSKQFVGPDGSTASFYVYNISLIWDGHQGDSYLQYKVYLCTKDISKVGILKEVIISYNRLPSVTISTPTGIQQGDVFVDYTLFDSESDEIDITFEYSTNGSQFYTATICSNGSGLQDLSSSPQGTTHSLVWDSKADLNGIDSSTVLIRIIPTDTDIGTTEKTPAFHLDNKVPLLEPTSSSGIVSSTSTTLLVTTNENAFVRWSDSNVSYGNMENQFTQGEGTTEHSTQIETEDGDLLLYISAADTQGNAMSFGELIYFTVDTKPPEDVSISINNGDECTNSPFVNLTISASDGNGTGLDKMAISNSKGFVEDDWEVFNKSKKWELTGDDGIKTVYVKVKDKAKNTAEVVSNTIILDHTPPELLSLGPLEDQSSKVVTLTVKTNEIAYLRWDVSNVGYYEMENQFVDGEGEMNHSTQIEVTEGPNTFYVSAIDNCGNAMTYGMAIDFDVKLDGGNQNNPGDAPTDGKDSDDTSPNNNNGETGRDSKGSSMWWLWSTIVVLLICGIIGIAIFILKRKGTDNGNNKVINEDGFFVNNTQHGSSNPPLYQNIYHYPQYQYESQPQPQYPYQPFKPGLEGVPHEHANYYSPSQPLNEFNTQYPQNPFPQGPTMQTQYANTTELTQRPPLSSIQTQTHINSSYIQQKSSQHYYSTVQSPPPPPME